MVDISNKYVYHIVNIDRLRSILSMGYLYADLTLDSMDIQCGTSIAYEHIRQRRRTIPVEEYPGLTIGGCVPFYFGLHSPMLYRAMCGNSAGYDYSGGQDPIVYLVFKLDTLVTWAGQNALRWIFTDRNAADHLSLQYNDLRDLERFNWGVIRSKMWQGNADVKAAEFLVENKVSIEQCLFGVATRTSAVLNQVQQFFKMHGIDKPVKLHPEWYF